MASSVGHQEKTWLKIYQKGLPENIDYEDICMPDIHDCTACKYPNKPALTFMGIEINFARLKDFVNKHIAFLIEVKTVVFIANSLLNVLSTVISLYVTLKKGVITVMNSSVYSDREPEHQFNGFGSKVLIMFYLSCDSLLDFRWTIKSKYTNNFFWRALYQFHIAFFPFLSKKKTDRRCKNHLIFTAGRIA